MYDMEKFKALANILDVEQIKNDTILASWYDWRKKFINRNDKFSFISSFLLTLKKC
jgi:hypothetical protein